MTSPTPEIRMMPRELLRPGPGNLRNGAEGWPESDPELAASVKALGILEPLLVREADWPGGLVYEVIAGHRRAAAAMVADLAQVPVIVRQVTDREAVQMALVENLQREDLSPIEEGRAYQKLLDLGAKQKELAGKIGRSQSHVSKRLQLLKLPASAQAYLDAGKLLVEDALAMVGMDDAQAERALHDIEALAFRRQGEVGELIGKLGQAVTRRKRDDDEGRGAEKEQAWELYERDLVVFRELARKRISQTAAAQRLRRLATGRDQEWDAEDLVSFMGLALGDTKAPRRRKRSKEA